MKKSLLTTLALTALLSTNAFALQSLTDEEMSNSSIEGISESAIVPMLITNKDGSTVKVSVVDTNRIVNLMSPNQTQIDTKSEGVSQAILDANMAANNVAIERSQLRTVLNSAIAKQDQAAQALADAFKNGVANGANPRNSAALAIDGVGQIIFNYMDGKSHTFTRVIDDGCTGTSICFHTESRTIDTTKMPVGLSSVQIIMGK